jgi:hypothetical protein
VCESIFPFFFLLLKFLRATVTHLSTAANTPAWMTTSFLTAPPSVATSTTIDIQMHLFNTRNNFYAFFHKDSHGWAAFFSSSAATNAAATAGFFSTGFIAGNNNTS